MATSPVCLVTGANAGVGYMAALGLAQRGAIVLLGCRNEQRARTAQRDLIAATKNNKIHVVDLDLADLGSVQSAAAFVEDRFGRLDVLINNAALYNPTQSTAHISSDGFEMVFATNFVGHAALTLALLPLLQATKPGRVISISDANDPAKGDLQLDDPVTLGKKAFDPKRSYIHSKLALETWTLALAARSKPSLLIANVLRLPALKVDPERLEHFSFIARRRRMLARTWAMQPERAAAAYVALGLSSAYEQTTGKLFTTDLKTAKAAKTARNKKAQMVIWDWSQALVAPLVLV